MASLGFAACLQELLSDRRARILLNFLTSFACEILIVYLLCSVSQRSASRAALQPEPAATIA